MPTPTEFPLAKVNPVRLERPYFEGRIPAGFPSPAAEYLEHTLDLHEYLVRNKTATFYFKVSGDSMIGARIFDADYLVVDRSINAKSGHVVVASINGEFVVKRLYRRGGVVELRSENPKYKPILLEEEQELVIFGVVTGIFCRFAA